MVAQRQELTYENNDIVVTDFKEMRSMHEIQAGLMVANACPRDESIAFQNIINACKRISLAVKATYVYPRGNTQVRGASIRLAETIARNWTHISCGLREVSQQNGVSVMVAWAVDLQANNWKSIQFHVPHKMQLSDKSMKILVDPRDIYEHTANMGARRVRACILALLPADIIEAAIEQCDKVIMDEDRKKPMADRIRDMVNLFDEYGIRVEHLEKRLGHKIDLTIEAEILEMGGIYNSLRDNMSKREDWFEITPPVSYGNGMAGFKAALGLSEKSDEPKIERIEIDGEIQTDFIQPTE